MPEEGTRGTKRDGRYFSYLRTSCTSVFLLRFFGFFLFLFFLFTTLLSLSLMAGVDFSPEIILSTSCQLDWYTLAKCA